MSILSPPPLKPGDTIRVVHAAGATDIAALDRGIAAISAAGYVVRHDPSLGVRDGYLAGTDRERAADLLGAIEEQPGAIIFARGGYGSMRILDLLPADALRRKPTWLVGYSDITALHSWAHRQGVATIHGPMVAGFSRYTDSSVSDMFALLADPRPPSFSGLRTIVAGQAQGPLIGGNLSLVCALLGSSYLPTLAGSVLLLEEVGEPAYRIDRMLTQLLISPHTRGIAGLVFGDFTRCGDAAAVDALIAERCAGRGVPAIGGLKVGHGESTESLILGARVQLDASAGLPASLVWQAAVPPMSAPSKHSGAAPVFLRGRTSAVDLALEATRDGTCTGLQLDVQLRGETTHRVAVGETGHTDDAVVAPVTHNTRFDLASVTKAISTAVLAHVAIDEALVTLDDVVPATLSMSGATLGDLLRHASGLPAWLRIYDDARASEDPRTTARARFAALEADSAQRGACVYSDPGYIVLGWWLELLFERPLDRLFEERIAAPLGRATLAFRPPMPLEDSAVASGEGATFAATEYSPYHGRTIQGFVHDEHTQVLGGACGHAGLFGCAADVSAVANSLLGFGPQVLSPSAVARMWDRTQRVPEGSYTLGWDTPSIVPSMAGSLMSVEHTVGHLGFTGTSLWIDRSRDVSVTLLTNRVHPTRDNARIRSLRPAIHDAVMQELGYG